MSKHEFILTMMILIGPPLGFLAGWIVRSLLEKKAWENWQEIQEAQKKAIAAGPGPGEVYFFRSRR